MNAQNDSLPALSTSPSILYLDLPSTISDAPFYLMGSNERGDTRACTMPTTFCLTHISTTLTIHPPLQQEIVQGCGKV